MTAKKIFLPSSNVMIQISTARKSKDSTSLSTSERKSFELEKKISPNTSSSPNSRLKKLENLLKKQRSREQLTVPKKKERKKKNTKENVKHSGKCMSK